MHEQQHTATNPTVTGVVKSLTQNQQRMLELVIEICEETQHQLWLVGGIIRDYLKERTPTDIDLVTDGDALALGFELIDRTDIAGINISTNPTLFACSISIENVRLFDMNSMRYETYSRSGKLPIIKTTNSITTDLERRDFTVNSMALGLTTGIYDKFLDLFDGKTDQNNGVLRVLHGDSLLDDPSRIFRAARYCTSHGYSISSQIETSLSESESKPLLLTHARLHRELLLTSQSDSWLETILLLDKWGIWRRLGLRNVTKHLTAYKRRSGKESGLEEMLILLTLNEAPHNRHRFLTQIELSQESRKFISGSTDIFDSHDKTLTQERLDRLSTYPESWCNLVERLQNIQLADLRRSVEEWINCEGFLTAKQLIQLGIPAGPELSRTLAELKWARFTKTIESENDARDLVKRMVTSR